MSLFLALGFLMMGPSIVDDGFKLAPTAIVVPFLGLCWFEDQLFREYHRTGGGIEGEELGPLPGHRLRASVLQRLVVYW
jgi:hypothetical protein